MMIAFVATAVAFTACGSDDNGNEDGDGNGTASGGFYINGTPYSADGNDTYRVYNIGSSESPNILYEYMESDLLNGANGYMLVGSVHLGNGSVKAGDVLKNDASDTPSFKMDHFGSNTNLTWRENDVEYVSGNVSVTSKTDTSITLKFNDYKISLPSGNDKGTYTLNGSLTYTQKD